MKLKLSFVTLIILVTSHSFAQLKIGDKVPDITLENIINYRSPTAKLSDFRGKMLIIDFWATWCVPCVRVMPELDSLQQQFKDQLFVLPVTDEKKEKVLTFLKNIQSLKNVHLPFVTQSPSLDSLFPHKTVPYDVIIDKNGKVLAITSIENITSANITQLLKGKSPVMRDNTYKPIENFNSASPFLQDIGETVAYQFLITKYYDGILGVVRRKGEPKYPADTMLTGTNLRLGLIYKEALLHSLVTETIPDNRVVLLIKDSSKFVMPIGREHNKLFEWEKNNFYCFTMIISPTSRLNVYDELKNNLDHFFNYNSRIEKRKMKCLVISNIDSSKYKSKGGKMLFDEGNILWSLNNIPFDDGIGGGLLDHFNYYSSLPIVNETGFKGNVDITLQPSFNNIESFRQQLNRFGLDVKESERMLDVMVIEDRN